MTKEPLLSVRNLHVSYGAIRAIRGIDLEVYEGEIVCVIGANGAGKSTLMNAIIGNVKRNRALSCSTGSPWRDGVTRRWPRASPSLPRGGRSSLP